ncbi:hypothetical protein L1987_53439 [Smallanthus sonchifolius]|uniref:Uncharacterized protein n=1 Tax=Smallanthus sonchifolius TaxID=185202 RepID=A0ACB9EVU8_9ASTR|nr:hypothetical protein L1987_53439 [Smallanthus sonchifolius]
MDEDRQLADPQGGVDVGAIFSGRRKKEKNRLFFSIKYFYWMLLFNDGHPREAIDRDIHGGSKRLRPGVMRCVMVTVGDISKVADVVTHSGGDQRRAKARRKPTGATAGVGANCVGGKGVARVLLD